MAEAAFPIRRYVRVSGRVQGVSFRMFVQSHATANGLTGWVRNLADGDVELELQGPPDKVEAVMAQVRKGPTMAHVSDVKADDRPVEHSEKGFRIRH